MKFEVRKDMQHDAASFAGPRRLGSNKSNSAPMLDRRIHPRRKKSDWIWYGLLAVAIVLFVQLVVENPRWQWDVVAHYLFNKRVISGLENTVLLTVLASALGLCFGVVVAACRMSDNAILRTGGYIYVWVIRATPTLVMLLFLFFLSALVPRLYLPLPFVHANLFDVQTNTVISRFSAAVLGLALYLGGYSAEIFRGGISAVEKGQREACKAIGNRRKGDHGPQGTAGALGGGFVGAARPAGSDRGAGQDPGRIGGPSRGIDAG